MVAPIADDASGHTTRNTSSDTNTALQPQAGMAWLLALR